MSSSPSPTFRLFADPLVPENRSNIRVGTRWQFISTQDSKRSAQDLNPLRQHQPLFES
jgi:hypothetical protein